MKKNTKDKNDHVFRHCRELFYIWWFLAQEGLLDEALEFVKDHRDGPAPFDTVYQAF